MSFDRRKALQIFGATGLLTAGTSAVAGIGTGLFGGEPAQASGTPTQFRGLWIATVQNTDWPSDYDHSVGKQKAELRGILDAAKKYNFNAVLSQVRPTADTFWPSKLEPWSKWLTGKQGKDPGFDPVAFQIAEAHKRGLEFHAWFNPFRICAGADWKSLATSHPAKKHPEWVVHYGDGYYYNPGLPEVRRFVRSVVLELVGKYAVDGVHFDDYFYPYPVEGKEFDDKAAFKKYGKGKSRGAWRRANITAFVRDIHQGVREVRSSAKFGISPFGIWRNSSSDDKGSATHGLESYSEIYADSYAWVKNGYVDYIVPQLYWEQGSAAADYNTLAKWWAGVVSGTKVKLFIGQGAYRLADGTFDKNELGKHLSYDSRFKEISGEVFFSATDVVKNRKGVFSDNKAKRWKTKVKPWPGDSTGTPTPKMDGGTNDLEMSGGVGDGGLTGGATG